MAADEKNAPSFAAADAPEILMQADQDEREASQLFSEELQSKQASSVLYGLILCSHPLICSRTFYGASHSVVQMAHSAVSDRKKLLSIGKRLLKLAAEVCRVSDVCLDHSTNEKLTASMMSFLRDLAMAEGGCLEFTTSSRMALFREGSAAAAVHRLPLEHESYSYFAITELLHSNFEVGKERLEAMVASWGSDEDALVRFVQDARDGVIAPVVAFATAASVDPCMLHAGNQMAAALFGGEDVGREAKLVNKVSTVRFGCRPEVSGRAFVDGTSAPVAMLVQTGAVSMAVIAQRACAFFPSESETLTAVRRAVDERVDEVQSALKSLHGGDGRKSKPRKRCIKITEVLAQHMAKAQALPEWHNAMACSLVAPAFEFGGHPGDASTPAHGGSRLFHWTWEQWRAANKHSGACVNLWQAVDFIIFASHVLDAPHRVTIPMALQIVLSGAIGNHLNPEIDGPFVFTSALSTPSGFGLLHRVRKEYPFARDHLSNSSARWQQRERVMEQREPLQKGQRCRATPAIRQIAQTEDVRALKHMVPKLKCCVASALQWMGILAPARGLLGKGAAVTPSQARCALTQLWALCWRASPMHFFQPHHPDGGSYLVDCLDNPTIRPNSRSNTATREVHVLSVFRAFFDFPLREALNHISGPEGGFYHCIAQWYEKGEEGCFQSNHAFTSLAEQVKVKARDALQQTLAGGSGDGRVAHFKAICEQHYHLLESVLDVVGMYGIGWAAVISTYARGGAHRESEDSCDEDRAHKKSRLAASSSGSDEDEDYDEESD